jgi:hypothetical protein
MRRIIAAVFMLILTAMQISYVYASQSGELNVEDIYWMPPTNTVKPGGIGSLVVVVKNIYSREVKNIDATLDISSLSRDEEAKSSFRGSLEPMCTASLVFENIRISEDAKASQYSLSLKLTYWVSGYIKTLKLKIPVSLAGAPEIHLYGSMIHILPNEEKNFTVTIVNTGSSAARRIIVVASSLTPLLTVTGENRYRISILSVSESISLNFSIHASSNAYGSALIRVDVAYMDEFNNIYNTSRTFTAIFSVKAPQFTLLGSSYIPSKVYPGDSEVSVLVSLVNSGEDKAEDVEVSLILPEGFRSTTPSSTRASVGVTAPGQVLQLKFYVDIDESAKPSNYSLTLNVTYKGGFQIFNIPIQVSEKASFKILSITPRSIHAGDTKVKIMVNLKNTGNVDADSVSLELIGGNRVTGTTVDYLGLIEAGGEKYAMFIVDVDENTPIGELNAKINVIWLQDSRMFTQSINVTFNILKPRSLIDNIREALSIAAPPYLLVAFIIAVTVLVVLIAATGRRK